VDLASMHAEIAGEVDRGFAELLGSGAFVQGPQVTAFERAFAEFSEVQHCVGVANGTRRPGACPPGGGVGQGDEVILPANTFIATPKRWPGRGRSRSSSTATQRSCSSTPRPRRRGSVPGPRPSSRCTCSGRRPPSKTLAGMAKDLGVALVEDHAQSHGATRNGRAAGSLGIAAATSFYPGKNLGAYGDGGAVLTDSDEVAARIRALGNHGSPPATSIRSLASTPVSTASRRWCSRPSWPVSPPGTRRGPPRPSATRSCSPGCPASRCPPRCPATPTCGTSTWCASPGGAAQRDAALSTLHAAGVGAGIHYPVPVHLQGAFAGLGHGPGDFPVAEAAAASMLSLPLFPHISDEQIDHVVRVVTAAVS